MIKDSKINEIISCHNVNCLLQVGNMYGQDVDLFVFYENDGEFLREVIKVNEVDYDISYMPLNVFKQGIKEKWDFLFNALQNYHVIYKKDEMILSMIEKIKTEKKEKLSSEEIDYYRFYFYEQLSDLNNRRNNNIDALFLTSCILQEIIIFYLKTKQIFIPKNKKLLSIVIKNNEKLGKLCYDFILENTVDEKIMILTNILDEVLRPYGGFLKKWQKGRFPLK